MNSACTTPRSSAAFNPLIQTSQYLVWSTFSCYRRSCLSVSVILSQIARSKTSFFTKLIVRLYTNFRFNSCFAIYASSTPLRSSFHLLACSVLYAYSAFIRPILLSLTTRARTFSKGTESAGSRFESDRYMEQMSSNLLNCFMSFAIYS
jgi:hypothetical protein